MEIVHVVNGEVVDRLAGDHLLRIVMAAATRWAQQRHPKQKILVDFAANHEPQADHGR